MIQAKIKIGTNGEVKDTYEDYGLCYISADNTVGATTKDFEATSYPEQEGENILPKTVEEAYDFKVEFLVAAKEGLGQAAAVVEQFNSSLYTQAEDSTVREYKPVTLYIPTREVTIVGYPKPISVASDYWYDKAGQKADAALVEFTIRVTQPSLCNYHSAKYD